EQNLAAHVYGDLLRKVSPGDRRGDLGDVADLTGKVAGHRIYGVSQVFPSTSHAGNEALAAEFSVGADFASAARRFRGEGIGLVLHRVDGVLEGQDFAPDVHGNLSGEITARHRRCDLGDVADLAGEVAGHGVYVVSQILPGAGDSRHSCLAAELSFCADLA